MIAHACLLQLRHLPHCSSEHIETRKPPKDTCDRRPHRDTDSGPQVLTCLEAVLPDGPNHCLRHRQHIGASAVGS